MVWISYSLAFKKTLNAFQTHQQLKSKLSEVSDLSYQPDYLERKNKNLDLILKQYQSDSLALRGNTLSQISEIAEKEGVKLSEVPVQDPFYNTPNFIIERLDFEGDYFALLKTLNHLQSTKGIGIPRSEVWGSISKNNTPIDSKKLKLQILLEVSKR